MRSAFTTSKPERLLMRELRKQGTFPRTKYKIGKHRADIAFPDSRIAIQVTFPDATKQEILNNEKEDEKIKELGWQVIRYSPKELENKYSEIVEGIKLNVDRNKILFNYDCHKHEDHPEPIKVKRIHEETSTPLIKKEEKGIYSNTPSKKISYSKKSSKESYANKSHKESYSTKSNRKIYSTKSQKETYSDMDEEYLDEEEIEYEDDDSKLDENFEDEEYSEEDIEEEVERLDKAIMSNIKEIEEKRNKETSDLFRKNYYAGFERKFYPKNTSSYTYKKPKPKLVVVGGYLLVVGFVMTSLGGFILGPILILSGIIAIIVTVNANIKIT